MEIIKKKIMMVDDDPLILKIGRHFLSESYEVYPLPSAAKLFEILEKVTPDLILLDVVMPEMGGVEALKRLKADERYAAIPVIFVSSIGDDQSVFEHLKLGAYSNIAKPFTSEELHNRIENCLKDYFPVASKKDNPQIEESRQPDKLDPDEGKKVILAIDDAPEILRMIHLLLRDTYKIYTLSEPKKFEALIKNIQPDLFILDFKMPEVSGIDLIPIIRKNPRYMKTPVIFLTSEKSPAFVTEAVRQGACDFVLKPIRAEVLREKVTKHIK